MIEPELEEITKIRIVHWVGEKDYLVVGESPEGERIIATCPYESYAEYVAESLQRWINDKS